MSLVVIILFTWLFSGVLLASFLVALGVDQWPKWAPIDFYSLHPAWLIFGAPFLLILILVVGLVCIGQEVIELIADCFRSL